jgi:hypothetical protein
MEEMSQWENLIAEKKQETVEEYQKKSEHKDC